MNRLFLVLLFSLGFAALASADETSYGGGKPPRAEAAFTKHPPIVDGAWNDEEWKDAKPIFFPVAKTDADSNGGNEVRFLWSVEGVYVAFRCVDPTPAYGHAKEGEPLYQEDVFELFIDQSGDHKQYYELQIDPTGQIYLKNYVLTASPRLTEEARLDQEFVTSELWRYDIPRPEDLKVASRREVKTGAWTVELFLPAAFVNRRHGGAPMSPASWRINLVRHDWNLPKEAPDRKVRFLYWAPVLDGHPHLSPEAMGYLELKP